ncbi:MAG: UPF0489 family protein [Candidatus Shapirobacteria bacterium]|jgi:hypothetical protein
MSVDSKNLPLFKPEVLDGREMYSSDGYSLFYCPQRADVNAVREIPRLKVGNASDVQMADRPYISYKFGYKEERIGLKEFVCIPETENTPRIYIVDEHHHVFYCWAEAEASGLINSNSILIHIDDHGDASNRTNRQIADLNNLTEVARFTNELLSEDEFVKTAKRNDLLGDAVWVDDQLPEDVVDADWHDGDYPKVGIESKTVHDILDNQDISFVLDIDLDFFARHLYEWTNEKLIQNRRWPGDIKSLLEHDLEIVRSLIKKAKVVTIATSPGYLQPEFAKMLIQELLE